MPRSASAKAVCWEARGKVGVTLGRSVSLAFSPVRCRKPSVTMIGRADPANTSPKVSIAALSSAADWPMREMSEQCCSAARGALRDLQALAGQVSHANRL